MFIFTDDPLTQMKIFEGCDCIECIVFCVIPMVSVNCYCCLHKYFIHLEEACCTVEIGQRIQTKKKRKEREREARTEEHNHHTQI